MWGGRVWLFVSVADLLPLAGRYGIQAFGFPLALGTGAGIGFLEGAMLAQIGLLPQLQFPDGRFLAYFGLAPVGFARESCVSSEPNWIARPLGGM